MKTKYGEIKTRLDYFEQISEREEPNRTVGFGVIHSIIKCKICGDEIEGLAEHSMGYSSQFVREKAYSHIGIHIDDALLKLI